MKFIFSKKIKYCTKEIIKYLKLATIALFIAMTIIFIKYKPVFVVSSEKEQLGYINSKKDFQEKLNKIVENDQSENVAFIDTVELNYEVAFVSNNTEVNEDQIISKINDQTKITYKYYAVTINNEQKSIVNTLDEAENLVAELKEKYSSINAEIGINEVYTNNKDEYKTVDIKVAKEEISTDLNKIKSASVNGIYLSQKPITGVITSRFGSRESIRSHAHTGLDIAAPYGTKIKSATEGTVIWSGEKGSYGNLIIVDCGKNVQIYYGHCSKLYVKEGQKVKAGDVLGAVGSTGNSTGNHLHFEIKVNGVSVNPQKYIYK